MFDGVPANLLVLSVEDKIVRCPMLSVSIQNELHVKVLKCFTGSQIGKEASYPIVMHVKNIEEHFHYQLWWENSFTPQVGL